MATISSIGLGSGLEVESIITKLVELEKAPLTQLEAKAALITTRISTYSQIKSLASTLSDTALKLSLSTNWKAVAASSSDPSAVSVTGSGTSTPVASAFSIQVQQLAKAQSTSTESFPSASGVGSGTLNIQLGEWNAGSFTAGAGSAISVAVAATDTPAQIAAKINAAGAGVTATVLTDSTGQRLLVRSSATGEASGFRIQAVNDGDTMPDTSGTGLSRLAFDPEAGTFGMATNTVQYGQDAQATINSVPITSASNTFTDVIPGLSFTATKETTTAVEVSITSDTATMKKSVQDFVTAYNAFVSFISEATKYNAGAEEAGLLQGDSAAISMQNALRALVGATASGGAFQRLSDIGVSVQQDGSLAIDDSKLTNAMKDLDSVRNLFTGDATEDDTSDGFGVRLKSLMSGLLATNGTINNRTEGLKSEEKQNTKDQDKVNDRAERVETRLRRQYTALDAQMAQLNALNTYIEQQVAQWNKSTK
jgi:flagellar hook-associated protein 2